MRSGMSLLEVIIATTLLLAAVMALSQVAFLARRNATGADQRTRAQEMAQNIVAEMLAGARPVAHVAPTTMEEDEQWIYMIQVEAIEGAALSRVTVQVDRLDAEEEAAVRLPAEDEMGGFRLVHWVRSAPATMLDTAGSAGGRARGEAVPRD